MTVLQLKNSGVSVSGYLKEQDLVEILTAWAVPLGGSVTPQAPVPGTRMRHDMLVTLPNQRVYVELDGDSHYRDANVIYRDHMKNKLVESNGGKIIRIPYFVQLTTEVFRAWFGERAEGFTIETDFPHGFITSKLLPASFCALGARRYLSEMAALQASLPSVAEQVHASLVARESLTGVGPEYIYA